MADEKEAPDIEKETVRGIFWFMLVFMLGATALIWFGLAGETSEFDAPRWVIVVIGVMFFNACLGAGMMDKMFNSLRQNWLFAGVQVGALTSVPFLLLVVLNWVAFGPGEKEFSLSVSIPFLTGTFPKANEWLGRAVFGLIALGGDLFVLAVAGKLLWEWVNGDGGEWRW